MNTSKEITVETKIRIPLKAVFFLTSGETEYGFVGVEESLNGEEPIFTPFTNEGLLNETHCFKCAIKSLLTHYEGDNDFSPCDRRDPSVEIEVHIISFGRQLH